MPRQVIRYLQLGLWEDVLKCNSVWMCENCQTCLARCPHEVDLPSLMEAVRQEAKSQGVINRDIDHFAHIFVSNIKRFGMSNEMLLSGLYNLKTGHLTQDIMSAPQLFKNQKLKIKPHIVKDKKAIARIFQKSLNKEDK
jgi:heterodisulfide reductase subunit C